MAVEPAPRRLTTDEFDELVRAGHWDEDDQVELLDGQVVSKSPVGDRHAYVVGLLDDLLREVYGREVKVWQQQQPLRLPPYDEPVPDIALLRRRADNYRTLSQAEDVLLVIEVADTVFRTPESGQYLLRGVARRGEVLAAAFDLSRTISVDVILP